MRTTLTDEFLEEFLPVSIVELFERAFLLTELFQWILQQDKVIAHVNYTLKKSYVPIKQLLSISDVDRVFRNSYSVFERITFKHYWKMIWYAVVI